MIGPTLWRLYSSDAATPKLPPPPRMAQNRSGFSSALARVTLPSAITMSADRRLSSARPYVGRALATRDHGRALVDEPVVDAARDVVAGIGRLEKLSGE